MPRYHAIVQVDVRSRHETHLWTLSIKAEREKFTILVVHVLVPPQLFSLRQLAKLHLQSQNRFTFVYGNNLDLHVL